MHTLVFPLLISSGSDLFGSQLFNPPAWHSCFARLSVFSCPMFSNVILWLVFLVLTLPVLNLDVLLLPQQTACSSVWPSLCLLSLFPFAWLLLVLELVISWGLLTCGIISCIFGQCSLMNRDCFLKSDLWQSSPLWFVCCIWVQLLLVKTRHCIDCPACLWRIHHPREYFHCHKQLLDCKGSVESVVKRGRKLKLITQV